MTAVAMTTTTWQDKWAARRASFAAECREARDDLLIDAKDPATAQRRVRDDVIRLCAASRHWKEQGYSVLADEPDRFRSVLPIRRYDDFAEEIDRETRTKGGVLSCSPVLRWLKTSGTTGTPKCVPYSLHWLLNYRLPAMKAMWGTYAELHPEILAHPHGTLDTQTVREDVLDFVHGVQHQAVSNRQPKLNSRDWNPPWHDSPWFGPDMPTDHEGRMYHRVRHLLGQDLHFISAINPSTLVSLRDIIATRRDELVRDVREGTLEGEPSTLPDEETARRLEAVLADDDFTLKDVWPSLTLYSCWLSASAGLYQSKLDTLFPDARELPFMSCGTEGVTTIPIDATAYSQPLAVGQAFFEFVPVEVPLAELLAAGETVETLLVDEVEEGRDYHLIMTQATGLYRLWTGDVYHVDSAEGGSPWVHFVHRDGVFHSFTGEKITEAQVTRSIQRGMAECGLETGLYLCGPRWGEPPNYVIVAEAPAPSKPLDKALSAAVDEALKEINIEYASKRDSGRLRPLEVVTVEHDAITAYTESRRQAGNANQYKYKPFQQDIDFVDEIVGH